MSRKLFEKGKVSEGNKWVFRAARDEELGALLDIALGKASNVGDQSKLDAKEDAINFLKKIQDQENIETVSTYLDIHAMCEFFFKKLNTEAQRHRELPHAINTSY